MSDDKHSAGPWQVMNDYDGATVVIANVDGETFPDGSSAFSYTFVCDTSDGDDDDRAIKTAIANARLISAAPDMLAALETIAAWDDGARDVGLSSLGPDQRASIDAAITKARGGAQ